MALKLKPISHIIVTGANGYIGRHFISYVAREGIEITAIIRERNAAPLMQKLPQVHMIYCDLRDYSAFMEMIPSRAYDSFYHFAWGGVSGSARADYDLQLDNVRITCNMAKAAQEIGCQRFIATGTFTENVVANLLQIQLNSENAIYGLTKLYTHKLLDILSRRYSIDYIWAELSNIYGGQDNTGNLISYTLSNLRKGQTPSYGPCGQPFNFTYIKDAVRALLLLGQITEHRHNSYFISNGECRLLKEYIEIVAKLYGGDVAIGARPDDGTCYSEAWFQRKEIQDEFGFKPQYTFEQGIKECLSLYRK